MAFLRCAAASALLLAATGSISQAQAPVYPDVTGTWSGFYVAAFPPDHDRHPGEAVELEMQLRVTRQENNLFWVENHWRVIGDNDWNIESGTGTFSPWNLEELVIVEDAPNPEHGSTGLLRGRLDNGRMLLIYEGIGEGISFAVALDKP